MTSKQKTSLRRKPKERKVKNQVEQEHDDDFDLKSPKRGPADDAERLKHVNVFSPKLRSPTVSATHFPRCKPSPNGNTSLDESIDKASSDEPTPSKWSYLLPDFNSQPEGAVAEVLWDCASPDAIKHLRRVQKGNNNIKELIKFFKEPTGEGRSKSPPLKLQLLRSSLQKQLQRQKKQKEPPDDRRKQRKLDQKRQKREQDKERERQLLGQMVSAVAMRQELETKEREQKERASTVTDKATKTVSTEEDDDDDDDDDDCWEDDELFENNSFIIAATQDPYQFLNQNTSKTSTPILPDRQVTVQFTEVCGSERRDDQQPAGSGSHLTDTQCSEVIPPTFVPRRRSAIFETKPKCLLDSFIQIDQAEECEGDGKTDGRAQRDGGSEGCGRVGGGQSTPSGPVTSTSSLHSLASTSSLNSVASTSSLQSVASTSISSSSLQSVASVSCSKPMFSSRNIPVCSATTCNSKQTKWQSSLSLTASTSTSNLKQAVSVPSKHQPSVPSITSTCTSKPAFSSNTNLVSSRGGGKVNNHPQTGVQPKVSCPTNLSAPAPVKCERPRTVSSCDKFSDDGLSDDIFLKVSDACDTLDSPSIHQFPTQATTKLCTRVTLQSPRPAQTHTDDFMDDLDPEILATICEYDSFSESPKCLGKGKNQVGKVVVSKASENSQPGPSDTKHPRLQVSAKTGSTTSTTNTVNHGKPSGHRSIAPLPIKAQAPSNKPAQNKLWSSRGTGMSSGLNGHNPCGFAGLSSTQTQGQSKPASSLTKDTGVEKPLNRTRSASGPANGSAGEKLSQPQSKFVFKPLSSMSSQGLNSGAGGASLSGKSSACSTQSVAKSVASEGRAFAAAGSDGFGDEMEDDPLFESQIMAMLDTVESQATQDASQMCDSQDTGLSKCSQDQIEKKRQAAMQRRLRSRSKTK